MKELTEKQREKLTRILTKGKWHYVILYGIVMWGIMTAILFRVLMICWNSSEESFWVQLLSAETLLALLILPICGIGFGLTMWKSMQKTARKHGLLK